MRNPTAASRRNALDTTAKATGRSATLASVVPASPWGAAPDRELQREAKRNAVLQAAASSLTSAAFTPPRWTTLPRA